MLFDVHGSVKEAAPQPAVARFLAGQVMTCRQSSWPALNFKFGLVDLSPRAVLFCKRIDLAASSHAKARVEAESRGPWLTRGKVLEEPNTKPASRPALFLRLCQLIPFRPQTRSSARHRPRCGTGNPGLFPRHTAPESVTDSKAATAVPAERWSLAPCHRSKSPRW